MHKNYISPEQKNKILERVIYLYNIVYDLIEPLFSNPLLNNEYSE